MFCGKCGCQIPEDADFCTKCGTPVKKVEENAESIQKQTNKSESSADNDPLTHVLETDNSQKKDSTVGKKKWIIGGIVAAIVIIGIVCFANLKKYKTIDLNNFVTISTEGYEGYGEAKYEINSDALYKEFVDKYKLNKSDSDLQNTVVSITDGLGLTDMACAEAFLMQLGSYSLSKKEDLSNGDKIVFSWDTLNSNNGEAIKQRLRDWFSINVEYSDINYDVIGLKPTVKDDPFKEIEFSFNGVSGTNDCSLIPVSSNDYAFSLEEHGPYNNGDKITIKANPSIYPNMKEFTKKTGKEMDPETRQIEISGLHTLITQLDQIPEDYYRMLVDYANTQVGAYVSQMIANGDWYGKQDVFDTHFDYSSPILSKEYLLSSQNDAKNELIFLYRVDYHVVHDLDGSGTIGRHIHGSADFPLYVGFKFDNNKMLLDSSGLLVDDSVSGEMIDDENVNDDLMVYFELYDMNRNGEYERDWYGSFDEAYTLEGFELDHINTRTENKDIRVIDEYKGDINVKEFKKL